MDDCQERNKQSAGDKNLPYLKVFFAAAHREWRLSIQNETGAPYGEAHNATTNLEIGYLYQYTVDAIANLTMATASDCTAISQLIATVARLMTDITMVNENIVIALQDKRAICGSRGGRGRAACGQGARYKDRARAIAITGAGSPALAETSV